MGILGSSRQLQVLDTHTGAESGDVFVSTVEGRGGVKG